MKRFTVPLLVALAMCQGVAFIFAMSQAHRLELERSLVWEAGYEQGMYYALQASREQFIRAQQSGRFDIDAMNRLAMAGRTNNPFGMPATNYGPVEPLKP